MRRRADDSRFVELEDHEAGDENRKREQADHDNGVTPTHVVCAATARRLARLARRKRRVASVVRNETPRDERGDDDADGLKRRQGAQQEPAVVGQELQGDGRIDRNIATDAESDAEREEAEGIEVTRRSKAVISLSSVCRMFRATTEQAVLHQAENRRDEALRAMAIPYDQHLSILEDLARQLTVRLKAHLNTRERAVSRGSRGVAIDGSEGRPTAGQ